MLFTRKLRISVTASLVFFLLMSSLNAAFALPEESEPQNIDNSNHSTWIIKWKDNPPLEFMEESLVVKRYETIRTMVVKPRNLEHEQNWSERWKSSPYVEYMHRNEEVSIAARPNDPLRERQRYLKQIYAEEAWDIARTNNSIVVALVDTGIDLEHPDLQDNLIEGVNLIDPAQPPMDDNGHGTNVAGVIAGVGNNNRGVAGVLWQAKIMPIKALDADGRGDEAKLGEAIRYAVIHGAKIVVLSVGLLVNDPYLKEVVAYAEQQGVLLVAASGNDEGEIVRYPAAYPTVLAVGGIGSENQVEERSNFGQEIDVVAPWSVYTTALGGKYEEKDGTSMAAPQVAGIAALIWGKYPSLKPYEIRNLIRQTAEDVGPPGWDKYTGYGLLRADLALTQPLQEDIYEDNDVLAAAKIIPLNHTISAQISTGADSDWYLVDAPYDGTVSLDIQSDAPAAEHLQVEHYTRAGQEPVRYANDGSPMQFQTVKGKSYIRLTLGGDVKHPVPYQLTARFTMYRDVFENNDRQYQAYALPNRSETITGTFHQDNDQDWFVFHTESSGTLTVSLTTDTDRIDPVVLLQKKGEKGQTFDQQGAGTAEHLPAMDILPGAYYIRVTNVPESSVIGEYQLHVAFTPKFVDPNEPNEKSYQSVFMQEDIEYSGVFAHKSDQDWFSFQVNEQSFATIHIRDIPDKRILSVSLLDQNLRYITFKFNPAGTTSIELTNELPPGDYYVRVESNDAFEHQVYRLRLSLDPLVAGFRDIHSHWAKDAIRRFAENGWVDGYGNHTFAPDREISRMEAVALMVRIKGYSNSRSIDFRDITQGYWGREYLGKALQAGLIEGYPDGTFRPNSPLTRMEMAALIANLLNYNGTIRGSVPFADVSDQHWGAAILKQLAAEGLMQGYADGTFQPNRKASRAEFISVLSKLF